MWNKAEFESLYIEAAIYVRSFLNKSFEGVYDMWKEFMDNVRNCKIVKSLSNCRDLETPTRR